MRGYLCISKNKQNEYLNNFFDAYWQNDQDLTKIENIEKLLINLKINSEEFFKSVKEQSIKDKLIKSTTEAFENEVFGAPTFIINNKIFWGQDRLEYALQELSSV